MANHDHRADRKTSSSHPFCSPMLEQLEPRLLLSGSIVGSVWNDLNANGVRDEVELGLAGVTIYLDLNNNLLPDTQLAVRVDATDGEKTIPDNSTITSGLLVEGLSGRIVSIDPSVTIWCPKWHTHQDYYVWPSEVKAFLTSPNGTKVQIWDSHGYAEDVGAFGGEDPNGIWTLSVTDIRRHEWDDCENRLYRWSVTVTVGEPKVITMDDDPNTPDMDETGTYAFTGLLPGTYSVAEIQQGSYEQSFPQWRPMVELDNGGFESGDLSNWEAIGLASVQDASIGISPTEGTHQAMVNWVSPWPEPSNFATDAEIEAFLGLSAGSLDGLGNGDATLGSAIRRTVTVEAGDILRFDWNLLTAEYAGEHSDFAFFSVTPSASNVTELADVRSASLVSFYDQDVPDLSFQTDYHGVGHFFNVGGTYTIGIGVIEEGEESYFSALLIDNFMLNGGDGFHNVTVQAGQVVNDIDFGNFLPPGDIRGSKWNDLNGNGMRDEDEPGLEGWKIYLDMDSSGQWDEGEPFEITDANGDYAFVDLPPDMYMVSEVLQPGWEQTYPCVWTHGIQRASSAPDGSEADFDSYSHSISADGRYVAFSSSATNLIPGGTSGGNIFVYDCHTDAIELVSFSWDGSELNGDCWAPVISADGSYVAFSSPATNLVENDTNGRDDVFVYDRHSGMIECVSVAYDGSQGNGDSDYVSISADGRYVAFNSSASNLVPEDNNSTTDVFVYDRQSDTIDRVSIANDGSEGNYQSGWDFPSISANGRYVAFTSNATNLVPGDLNGNDDVFVYDRDERTIKLVSIATDGTQGNSSSSLPSISGDGRYVAFYSSATNLVPGDTKEEGGIFVYDRQEGMIEHIVGGTWSMDRIPPAISYDGRYVAFESDVASLVPDDTNGYPDIFLYDRQTEAIERLNMAPDGSQADFSSSSACISGDGRYVAFSSEATNLVQEDPDSPVMNDIFVTAAQEEDSFTSHMVYLGPGQLVENIDFGNLALPNDPPTADGQSVQIGQDGTIAILLSGSDIETPADQLAFSVVTQPLHGTVTLSGSGVRYIIDGTYDGSDSFAFTVTDTDNGASGPLTSDPATVTITGGHRVAFDLKGNAQIHDDLGNLATVSLKGGGTGSLFVLGDRNIGRIFLSGTTEKSSLTIQTKDAASSVLLWGLDTNAAPLAKITASTTVLSGLLEIGGSSNPKAGVAITLAGIHDGSIDSDLLIKSLTLAEWLDEDGIADHVAAPVLSKLTVRGDKRKGIAGDFEADLNMGTPGASVMGLGSVSIAGLWDGASVTIDGVDARTGLSIKSLKAGKVGDVNVKAPGGIGAISTSEWQSGLISAGWIGSVASKVNRTLGTTGNFGADLNLGTPGASVMGLGSVSIAGLWDGANVTIDGVDARTGLSIKSLKAGKVGEVNVTAPGGIGTISTSDWQSGVISAGWVGSVVSKVNRTLGTTGNFGADLVLTGNDIQPWKPTLGRATIAGDLLAGTCWDVQSGLVGSLTFGGTVRQSVVRSASNIKSITVGATDGSDFGAGVALNLLESNRHVDVGDVANAPQATIGTFTVKGLKLPKGAQIPRFFIDSNISAGIGKLNLLNWDGLGGLFAPAGGVKSVKHKDTADKLNCWVWPAPPLQVSTGPDDFIHII